MVWLEKARSSDHGVLPAADSLGFGNNPWNATGLEWQTSTLHATADNYEETPVVTEEPYGYPLLASVHNKLTDMGKKEHADIRSHDPGRPGASARRLNDCPAASAPARL